MIDYQAERARRDHERMIEWERIVQFWGMDLADPDSPFGQIAEKVQRAQFRAQLRAERESRGNKAIMQWWENLKNETDGNPTTKIQRGIH